MVLRLVSGPMLEKSSRTGPLTDRQKVLLTARFMVSLFLRFSTTRVTGKFSKKFSGISGFGKFPENFFELDYFDIFSDFQHFIINLCCFDNSCVARIS